MRGEVEAAAERGIDGERVRRGALVVDQSWKRQLTAARPPAGGSRRLHDEHVDALGCEGDGGSEPVGPAADHDGARHAVTASSVTGAFAPFEVTGSPAAAGE